MKVQKIFKGIFLGLIFLLPFFFLPITAEFYAFNKQTLLILATGVLLFLWALKLFQKKEKAILKRTPLDWPVLFMALAYLLATIIASPNKVEALTNSLSTTTILTLSVFFFLITNNFKTHIISPVLHTLTASASLLGLLTVFQTAGLGMALKGPQWFQSKLFTPTGNSVALLTFLGLNFIISLSLFLKKINQGKWLTSVWFFLGTLVIALGLVATFSQVLPGKETSFNVIPYRTSWAISIESLKQSPLFGVGPGGYLTAFNRFRPISFNNRPFWNLRFGGASSYPLQVLTIGGLVAFGAWFFLIIKTLMLLFGLKKMSAKESLQPIFFTGLLTLLVIQIFLPIDILVLTLTYLFLGLLGLTQAKKASFPFEFKKLSVLFLTGIPALILVVFYFWGRWYLADFYFRKSLNALAQNQGLGTYNYQIKAISLNPRLPSYRRAYSQTNFALANSLAAQTDLSDQDKGQVSALVQQAVNEAKSATVLNGLDAANWENLAQIYRSLINLAEGADQWTIAAYRQAIVTDPINPRIRINLGGLFYSLGNYEEAVRHFENAINLKPNHANAYYNLAAVYKEQKDYSRAFSTLQIVLNLLPANSVDYQKVAEELDKLKDKLPSQEASGPVPPPIPGELTEPEPLPEPAIEPIELPEEAGPEVNPEEKIPEFSPTSSPGI